MVLAHMLLLSASLGTPVPLRDALAFVKARRPRASPNGGFMAQLIELEVKLFGAASVDIDKYRSARFGEVCEYAIGDVAPVAWSIVDTEE